MNTEPLSVAFKEWAAICAALAEGRQSILLRKGGIAEEHGVFRVEHERFWLYPTYVHQQQAGLRSDWSERLAEAMQARPAEGAVRLSHWAEATRVLHLTELSGALHLASLHGWSEATVRQRFEYREPGIYVLAVRIHETPSPHVVAEDPAYLGCKSWVPLAAPLSTAGSRPVLSDAEHAARQASLDSLARSC